MPYDTIDPIPVAAEIVSALQAMVTRRFNAAEATVVSITRIQGGSTHNVVPDTVDMMGTIRTLSPERRTEVRALVHRVAEKIAAAHGCEASVTITEGFPCTFNDGRAVAIGEQVARTIGGDDGWSTRPDPTMGAEDFSYVLEKVPGAMFFIGAAAEGVDWQGCCGLHSSRMVLDESMMPRGSAFLAGCAVQFLDSGWS